MQYRIVCCGPRLVGYGPFDTEAEARNFADKYLQDYRNEFVPYEKVIDDLDENIQTRG
jgi:hypothetical protein